MFLEAYSLKHSFIHSSVAVQPFVGPWPLIQFRNIFDTDGRTPWTSDQPVARPLPTHRRTQTQNKRTHTHVHASSRIRTYDPSVRTERRQFMTFFLNLVCEAIGTAATPGLLCQPRVIVKMIVEKQMECRLAGETEVFGDNLPQRHFCPSQNPT
jgi:hypothetical protein